MSDAVDDTIYGLMDFVTSSNGQTIKSKKSVGLYHTGDYLVLRADNVQGVDWISVRQVRVQEETHYEAGIVTRKDSNSYNETTTIKTGQEKRIECKEQFDYIRPGTTGEKDRIGNVDITVTLAHVELTGGGAGKIDDPTDPNVATYTWVLSDLDGEELNRGDARSIGDAKTAAAGAATDAGEKYYAYKVFDEAGNQVWMDNVQPEGGFDVPWAWIVALIAIGVGIFLIWHFFLRGKVGMPGKAPAPAPAAQVAPAAPVAAPVATAPSVTVVK